MTVQEKTHKYKVLLAGGGINQEMSLLLNKSCLGQNLDYDVQFCSHLKNENWKGSEKDFGADWSMWNDLHPHEEPLSRLVVPVCERNN